MNYFYKNQVIKIAFQTTIANTHTPWTN